MKSLLLLALSFVLLPTDDSKLMQELKSQYRMHIADFSKQKQEGQLYVSCTYTPLELINTQRSESSKKQRELTFQIQLKTETSKEFLKIDTDTMTFSEKVVYYSNDFQNEILVEVDGTKRALGMYVFERSFNTGAPSKCLISFTVPEKSKKLSIKIQDKIYDKSIDTFEFDLKVINEFEKKLEKLK